jgi:hypothetical protein
MDAADPRLRMLFDYTIFHIGLYSTLVTALFTVMTFGKEHRHIKARLAFLRVTVVSFLVAGAAGGAIASNIPQFKTYDCYSSARLTVFWFSAHFSFLTHLEHGAFWVGIIVAAWGLLRE